MADDEAADEAGSGVCSNSSKYEENDTEALQSSSTDFSEAVSSINQRARMEDSAECRTPAPTKTTADGDSKTAASYGKQMAIGQVSHISVEDLAEIQYQKRYWHEYIGRYLYPASIRIEPDAHFSQSDCHVLGMIDARYQRMRWLETQARFYNETGRMVPLEVIRRKCDAAVRTESNIADWLERINN
ncbi:hypothetical protein IF2G_02153 [Cordyceps javanica]|nr:hypothetical protein IF2G_02153 [Cordyceps javanica]